LGPAWNDAWIAHNLLPSCDALATLTHNKFGSSAASGSGSEPALHPELQLLGKRAKRAADCIAQEIDSPRLDRAIIAWEDILRHPNFATSPPQFRADMLKGTASSFFRRWKARKSISDLDKCLGCWRTLELSSGTSFNRAALLSNLGLGLSERYEHVHELNDLDEAIRAYQKAIKLFPLNVPDLPECFTNLGAQLSARFAHLGELADLEAAVHAFRKAVSLTAPRAPNRAHRLSNLGSGLSSLYERTGQLADLQMSVDALQQALNLAPEGLPELSGLLNNLGTALSTRYAGLGDRADLEAALGHFQRAVDLTPKDSPDYPRVLTGRGNALSDRYALAGEPESLKAALRDFQAAVDLTPSDSPDRADYLHNLSSGLRACYLEFGNKEGIEAALRISQQIAELTLPGAPNLPAVLTSRGNLLSDRYAYTGDLKDLNEAISAYEQAAKLTPPKSPHHAEILNNPGTGLQDRYARTGDLEELNKAIGVYHELLKFTPPKSPQRAKILNNLAAGRMALHARGSSLKDADDRFRQLFQLVLPSVADLDEAVAAYRQAVELTPKGAPDRPGYLNNLGGGLHARYNYTNVVADLEDAILNWRQAAALTPAGSPDLPSRWNSLGTGLRSRYEVSGDPQDLANAIAAYQSAAELTPEGAPDRPRYLCNLATARRHRYKLYGDPADRKSSIRGYHQASRQGMDVALEQALTTSRSWGGWALERRAWREACQAYGFGLKAIEALFRTQLLRAGKETWLHDAQGLHTCAAYAHARCGKLSAAVAILEQGNARMLSEALARDRADLQALKRTHRDLVTRYHDATARLFTLRRRELGGTATPTWVVERIRTALQEFDALVADIRQVKGFDGFLRAAISVPLVYLAVTPVGALALLVGPDGNTFPVWSDDLTEAALQNALFGAGRDHGPASYLGAYVCWRDNPKDQDALKLWCSALERTTRWLWKVFIGRLTHILARRRVSRVVLIPHGLLSLLPLHAAWTKELRSRAGRRYALDKILFTYAPNALALQACQSKAATLSTATIFAVEDPEGSLYFAADEVSAALTHFRPLDKQLLLGGPAANRSVVLKKLSQANVLHFATHGRAGFDKPLEAGLTMAGGEQLTLRDILRLRLKQARLAVLSACETGIPGTKLPDEIVSLPAGLVQVGVAGVLGSLWALEDRVAKN
jgi:tetratricopeptide (TPR) repeat protein